MGPPHLVTRCLDWCSQRDLLVAGSREVLLLGQGLHASLLL